ncbi:MAG: hypothetical protein LAT65_20280 [Saccharospirillum sp.]|nr:hypothetical protein [Saccharospirillum sp.]
MKVLVTVKRVAEATVKNRAKANESGVDLKPVVISTHSFCEFADWSAPEMNAWRPSTGVFACPCQVRG